MSSHGSPILFALAVGPAMLLAVVLHEFGHVLAARSVGLKVAAWGVGYRRPWFFCRIGSSVFYVGRPLSGGMMIPNHGKLEREPIKEFIMVLGGPLSSMLGLGLGLVGLGMGVQSAAVHAWIYVSAIYVLLSSIPHTFTSKSIRFTNDAKRLIHILRHGRESTAVPIGPALARLLELRELLADIQCEAGLRDLCSSIAVLQAVLGDVSSARISLAVASEHEDHSPLSFVARAAVAAADSSDDAESVFAAASEQCGGDATAEFLVDCLHEQWRLERYCSDSNQREWLRQRALAASRRDWMCWIECLSFEADISHEVERHCRALLRNYRHQLDGVSRARLLALTAERLAMAGDTERAEAVFQEAHAAISMEAASISSETTRGAYLRLAAKPLTRAAQLLNIDSPTFDGCPIQEVPPRRRVFAGTALVLSTLAFATIAPCSVLIARGTLSSDSPFAVVLILPAVLGALLALLAGMISILRSESNRWRMLSTALPLAFLALIVVAVGLSRK